VGEGQLGSMLGFAQSLTCLVKTLIFKHLAAFVFSVGTKNV
jgi:hypothetical protein